jgi:hypothetical protein
LARLSLFFSLLSFSINGPDDPRSGLNKIQVMGPLRKDSKRKRKGSDQSVIFILINDRRFALDRFSERFTARRWPTGQSMKWTSVNADALLTSQTKFS